MVAVALLFPPFGSEVVEETESVCVITVPDGVVVFTFTTNVKFAVPVAMAAVSVQVRVARTQFHPAGPVKETDVVLAGSVSVKTGAAAVAGPAFVTVCV